MKLDIYWIQCVLLATSVICLQTTQAHSISGTKCQTSPDNSFVFKSSRTFVVPCGVRRVRVLAVGGGSGGLCGDYGGGGSGYVRSGEFDVTPGESVPVAVGAGGAGSTDFRQNSKAGGNSSFGELLSAAGGEGRKGVGNLAGAAGGSGGGEGSACACGKTGGAGGTDGSKGNRSAGDCFVAVGPGQGSFSPHFKLFERNRLSAGAGGSGRSPSCPHYTGGGGGGGVLLNGSGPTAQAGTQSSSGGFGGAGFGAGGGAGGFYYGHHAGGRGADGLVYVEW